LDESLKRSGNGLLLAPDRARVGNAYTTADMTSSGLTPSRCVGLACFGDMVAEMSAKQLAQTKWWNNLLISLAWLYHC
jgi:hypothetical protein